MSKRQAIEEMLSGVSEALRQAPDPQLQQLLAGPSALHRRENLPSVVVGELIAIADEGCTPLVLFAGQHGTAAVRARAVIDLHGAHIGQSVVLMFEDGDAMRPVVMGVLRQAEGWPLREVPAQVEVDVNGDRMIVSAKSELVLRCGKASVTLTKAGKVLIQGSYVSSRSTGVNRIKGGSVQLN
ncbi:DUF6484 domain-containing protein [Variovorax sp. J22R133]|uniref:DUF6484 domain-containing protein n=1 Tax=Variovorax brevis TaxID=3053503 RepID=UPI0025773595|nr:DUF6484 domain-containing protein [Variovorax sp. J22R133]MDM0117233.1 DUF6484 domain-containing protein [Variovorax sp. J22R133]